MTAHHHHTMAPSGQGTVMLDIGADIGALVVYTPASCHGEEIEVSRADDPRWRKHAAVRARYTSAGVCWSVVVDGLREGRYVVWRDPRTAAGEIDVSGGAVSEFHYPEVAGR